MVSLFSLSHGPVIIRLTLGVSISMYLCLTISILHCDALCCHTYHASCLITTPQPTLMKRSCKPLPLERMAGVASLRSIYQHNQTIKIAPHSPIFFPSLPLLSFVIPCTAVLCRQKAMEVWKISWKDFWFDIHSDQFRDDTIMFLSTQFSV